MTLNNMTEADIVMLTLIDQHPQLAKQLDTGNNLDHHALHWLGHAIVRQKHRHHRCSISLGFIDWGWIRKRVFQCRVPRNSWVVAHTSIAVQCGLACSITIACHPFQGLRRLHVSGRRVTRLSTPDPGIRILMVDFAWLITKDSYGELPTCRRIPAMQCVILGVCNGLSSYQSTVISA